MRTPPDPEVPDIGINIDEDEAPYLAESGISGTNLNTTGAADVINIFEWKHPQSQGLFLFDKAPSHKKVAADALSAEKLNVRPGGKQPCLRDAVWNGTIQKMQLPDGRPKGMKLILLERGVCTDGMVAEKIT